MTLAKIEFTLADDSSFMKFRSRFVEAIAKQDEKAFCSADVTGPGNKTITVQSALSHKQIIAIADEMPGATRRCGSGSSCFSIVFPS